jgi:predicted O-methyltransferase YrrM
MTNLRTVPLFDVHTLIRLYRTYAEDLRAAREAQRELLVEYTLKPKLDDIEAELTYLALRETRPAAVVEIGSFHGWSTTWILRALRDNGSGHLHTFDLVDHATRAVPAELAGDRWTFVPGDARDTMPGHLPADPGYLFVDALHTAGFARWYTRALFPRLAEGTPVSVHDVFHGRRPWPFSEGSVVLGWLRERGIGYLTASAAHDPDLNDQLLGLKRKLRLAAPVSGSRRNPMLFFQVRRD